MITIYFLIYKNMKNTIWKIFEIYGLLFTFLVGFISFIYIIAQIILHAIIFLLFFPFMLRNKEFVISYFVDLVKIATFKKK